MLAGCLPEPEIYRRLCVAMNAMPARMPVLTTLAAVDRKVPRLRIFPLALAATFKLRPRLAKMAPLVLHETLGKALPSGAAAAAVLWAAAHAYAKKHAKAVQRAGIVGRGAALGEALFERILHARSGTVISTHLHDDVWSMIRHPDRRVHVAIDELLPQIEALAEEPAPSGTAERPLVLIAGERRAYNANTIYRDPAWRRTDREGALRIHPEDAKTFGLQDGAWARCESDAGAVEVRVEITERCARGTVTLPHGYGLEHPIEGERRRTGPSINALTRGDHCDPLTAVPYHKFVPVRVVR